MSDSFNCTKTTQARKLSRHVPKGWQRTRLLLSPKISARLHELLEPKIGEGDIVDAALWFDASGGGRRMQALYENGVLVDWKDDILEEFAPLNTFTISVPRSHSICKDAV